MDSWKDSFAIKDNDNCPVFDNSPEISMYTYSSNTLDLCFKGRVWRKVRSISDGASKWSDYTDQLAGTAATKGSLTGSGAEYNMDWGSMTFTRYLVMTGDATKWLIAAKSEVVPDPYPTAAKYVTIEQSSIRDYDYKAKWNFPSSGGGTGGSTGLL